MKQWIPAVVFAVAVSSLAVDAGGGKIKPVNLNKLNTPADETDPFVTPDGLQLFYASNAKGTWDIFLSEKSKPAQAWLAGSPYGDFASPDSNECSPHFWRERFFYATDWLPDEKFKDLKNYDIKQRFRQSAPLIMPGISEKEDEKHPWVTAQGKEFYFSRKMKESWILFQAKGPEPGPVAEAKPVGFAANFHHATLFASGLTMILQGPTGDARTGLFRSKRANANSPWSKPEPLKGLLSSESKQGDMAPCVSGDGLRVYFVSDRPGGQGGLDIWYAPTAQLK